MISDGRGGITLQHYCVCVCVCAAFPIYEWEKLIHVERILKMPRYYIFITIVRSDSICFAA